MQFRIALRRFDRPCLDPALCPPPAQLTLPLAAGACRDG
jgi:hypothetical protein